MNASNRTLVLATAGGALLVAACAGPLSMTAGLLVVALVVGWGAGSAAPARRGAAIAAALLAVVLGLLGAWAWSRLQGGTLDPLDLLARTFGLLAPPIPILAALAAWVTAKGEPTGPR